MEYCIACNKEYSAERSIKAKSVTNNNWYTIEFCKCGLGKTIIEGSVEQELRQANSEMYDDIERRVRIYYGKLHNHYTLRINELLGFIESMADGKKMLEVGANIGFTSSLAGKRGFEVEVCELNKAARDFIQMMFKFPAHEDFFGINKKFDVVTMLHVLEHFPAPDLGIQKAREILNLNGVLFVEVPNAGSKIAERLGGKWTFYNPPDHTYHFTPGSMKKMLEANGFDVEWTRNVNILEDFRLFSILPGGLRDKIISMIYTNPFYYPGYYERSRGSIIQMIARKKS